MSTFNVQLFDDVRKTIAAKAAAEAEERKATLDRVMRKLAALGVKDSDITQVYEDLGGVVVGEMVFYDRDGGRLLLSIGEESYAFSGYEGLVAVLAKYEGGG